MPRLRRVDCSRPGSGGSVAVRASATSRRTATPIVDREVLERISELAIPPAWKEVWICPHPRGHIQATGIDAARAQAVPLPPATGASDRDREKFDEMERFAKALPAMRERTEADLARRGLVRDRVLACSVRLLDLGFFRIGSERYTEENETFGLSTAAPKARHGRAAASPSSTTRRRAPSAIARRSPIPSSCRRSSRSWSARAVGSSCSPIATAAAGSTSRRADINEYLKMVMGGGTTRPRTSAPGTRPCSRRSSSPPTVTMRRPRRRASARRPPRPSASPTTSTTHPRSAAAPTSTPGSSTASIPGETIRPSLKRLVAASDPGEFVEREKIERAVLRLLRD